MTTQNTQYSKEVRKALIDREMNFDDLAREVSSKTGLYCSSSYLSHIFRGDRNAPRIVSAINEILGLEVET